VGAAGPALSCATAARDARHAYAVLSGLTSASGGMVAAATRSLPERARAGRNYDDRYAWIRDQCYAGHAGGRRPDEHRLPLPDYPGGTALAGNRVNAQFQLDALGAALLLFAAASARPATPTASAPTSARSATPTARSCCAGS
jgi:hypothetical protein